MNGGGILETLELDAHAAVTGIIVNYTKKNVGT